jgi:hypothetical protein
MGSVINSIMQRLAEQEKERNAHTRIKQAFPKLKDGEFEKTSKCDPRYNCFAHAAQEHKRKWEPVPIEHASNDRYWPLDKPRNLTVQAFIKAFETLGYEPYHSSELEEGYEKVAIYITKKGSIGVPKGGTTHMARQLPCGKWTSKLGNEWDICHDKLEGLHGKQYGVVKQILRRRKLLKIVRADEREKPDQETAREDAG